MRRIFRLGVEFTAIFFLSGALAFSACTETVTAKVVALDQPFMWNRLGTSQPQGMIFALESDVVPLDNPVVNGNDKLTVVDPTSLTAGSVRLRSDKRPRPIVLRVNEGACLKILFRNLLNPETPTQIANTGLDVSTRWAGLHASGLDLVGSIASDASWVGLNNPGSFVPPETRAKGSPVVYTTYGYQATAQGTYFLYTGSDDENDANNNGGPVADGLFGAVNVEPKQAEYYRSQVTRDELHMATLRCELPPGSQPSGNGTLPCLNFPSNMTLRYRTDPSGAFMPVHLRRSMFSLAVDSSELYRYLLTLTTVDNRRGTVQSTEVVRSPDGYLYAIDAEGGEHSGHPIINYDAVYPPNDPHGRGCFPILKMAAQPRVASGGVCGQPSGAVNLFYTDLTAIITGPNADRFPYSDNSPAFAANPASPDRREPFREFTFHYQNPTTVQAFQAFLDPLVSQPLGAVTDSFGINYGIAGIGAEILANRIGVGPTGNQDAVDLKFEEFFLSSWAVGDPAMVVDVPANAQNQVIAAPPPNPGVAPQPPLGGIVQVQNAMVQQGIGVNTFAPWPAPTKARATKAFFPDDPSNVYHSYMGDHVKMRILHAGGTSAATHVHHLHAHQWLRSPNSDDGHYLDSQMLTPGSAFTLEIAYDGSGNRNQTVGDSIFHCHFYPHFAGGMWGLWRVHDVFEAGTELDANGVPKSGINRALPDGEIVNGTPIPAIVPLPTLAMAPIPADVELTDISPDLKKIDPKVVAGKDGRRVLVCPDAGPAPVGCPATPNPTAKLAYQNPGYPFFVPGVAGHRPPHPPMDFAWKTDDAGLPIYGTDGKKQSLDGGLPRHVVLGGKIFREAHTRWDFTKDFVTYDDKHQLKDGLLFAYRVPENGTAVERAAMAAHAQRTHKSFLPDGDAGNFILNGLPPVPGAPFAAPDVTDTGSSNINTRRYKGADIQMNVTFNKKGWHFPQQRMITLWQDVKPTIAGDRPPQPFFFRAATGETVEYWQTNLVPNYYELDDFQVRTPTDIIGQHIHLVKFDVLASDGAANGFNYEDGTYSPEEVRERIYAIDHHVPDCDKSKTCGLYGFDDGPRQFFNPAQQTHLDVKPYRSEYPCMPAAPGCSVFGDAPQGQDWDGAQTTIQLWDTDPLLNNKGEDRTLRTVFTHDHFGPSTHQQAGLYGGLLVEPENSTWKDPVTGDLFYDKQCYDSSHQPVDSKSVQCPPGSARLRTDGGPTSWQANIITSNPKDSYREFALEFQDLQLAYTPDNCDPGSTNPCFKPAIPLTAMFSTCFIDPNTGSPVCAASVVTGITTGGPVTADVQAYFSRAGITLSAAASSRPMQAADTQCAQFPGGTVATPTTMWVMTDPASPGEIFCAGTTPPTGITSPTPGTPQIWVYAPSMAPGWSRPTSAIIPANDGNNAPSGAPFPTVISNAQNGSYSLNYRSEPVPLRINQTSPPSPQAGDLSYSFASISRSDPDLNCQPVPGALISKPCQAFSDTDFQAACKANGGWCPYRFPKQNLLPVAAQCPTAGGITDPEKQQCWDPFTPLLRAYQNDKVQVRTLVGAQLVLHSFEMQGVNWLEQPTYGNSGYRSQQGMGLSEHYEMLFQLPVTKTTPNPFADYLYQASAGVDGVTNGLWGIMRSYKNTGADYGDLKPLPNNDQPTPTPKALCAVVKPENQHTVVATPATLMYYSRGTTQNSLPNGQAYVEVPATYKIGDPIAVPTEPLILRVAAGECIQITLWNNLGSATPTNYSIGGQPIPNSPFGNGAVPAIKLNTSATAGLHPPLLAFDVTDSNGANVGFNPPATADNAKSITLKWFAGSQEGEPIEFGTVQLEPSDPLLQHFNGLVGALVVEPKGSTWIADPNTKATATVIKPDLSTYREVVLVMQNDGVIVTPAKTTARQGVLNYKQEPFALRKAQANPPPPPPPAPAVDAAQLALLMRFSTYLFGGTPATPCPSTAPSPCDPQTPILRAAAGDATRFHLAYAGGSPVNMGPFNIHGHSWQENPYIHGSTEIGNNPLSQTFGMEQVLPFQNSNFVLQSAGGVNKVPGDYLYELYLRSTVQGIWGIFRVQDITVKVAAVAATGSFSGTIALGAGVSMPQTVTVSSAAGQLCSATLTAAGTWSCQAPAPIPAGTRVIATTNSGGSAIASAQ
jgi:manganese oxidase